MSGSIRARVEEEIDLIQSKSRPKELQKARIQFDEDNVVQCLDTLNKWSPIFSPSTNIVSLSSGNGSFVYGVSLLLHYFNFLVPCQKFDILYYIHLLI